MRLLLQALVGIVDAELLEAVGDETFEAEYVKDAYEGLGLVRVDQLLVAALDKPPEEARVHGLAEGVARVDGLLDTERHLVRGKGLGLGLGMTLGRGWGWGWG